MPKQDKLVPTKSITKPVILNLEELNDIRTYAQLSGGFTDEQMEMVWAGKGKERKFLVLALREAMANRRNIQRTKDAKNLADGS
jgi:hypothetical protein